MGLDPSDAASFTAAKATRHKSLMAECKQIKTKPRVFQDILKQFLNKLLKTIFKQKFTLT